MDCKQARQTLSKHDGARPSELAGHLTECEACAGFSRRLEAALGLLAEPLGDHAPDGAFATRVVGALPATPELLGWAALRLLPATLALVLALTGWSLISAPGPGALLAENPTDDLVGWVLDSEEVGE